MVNESCFEKSTLVHVASETAKKLYYYVQWTGRFNCKKDFYIKRSSLDSYLLVYTKSGEGTLFYENRKYTVRKNTLFFLDCNHLHEYFVSGDGWDFKYIHFKGALSASYYSHVKKMNKSVVFMCGKETERYFDKVYEITKNAGSEAVCSEMIYHILIELIGTAQNDAAEKSDDFIIKDILYYISENYDKQIKAEELAEKFHFSRSYFSVVFKKKTGYSPGEYILNYRIVSAKRLLYGTDKPVGEIAARCGFADASSFIRVFKKAEGVTPNVYRKNIEAEKASEI